MITTSVSMLQPQTKTPSEFAPVSGGTDTTSAEALLVIAYIALWLLFFGFLVMTHRRQRGLDQKLDQLEQALKKTDNTTSPEST
jgi:CcmD family protein